MRIQLLKTLVAAALVCCAPAAASAEQREGWSVNFIPYFWAPAIDGNMSAGPATVPIFLRFSDAKDHLGGAFSFHIEASRGRFGVLGDLNFVRLSSSSTFTVLGRPIDGTVKLDNVIFELGGSYLLKESAGFRIIGGLRTYTVAPKLTFSGTNTGATPVDTSVTSPNGFVGFVIQPHITDKWTFIRRGDIGGGDAHFTWGGVVGFDYRLTSWGALQFGYKALGIDARSDDRLVRVYDVTHYGPIFSFRFHWGG